MEWGNESMAEVFCNFNEHGLYSIISMTIKENIAFVICVKS